MEFDLVYADLQATVTVKADNSSYFAHITDTEILILQQWIYLAMTCMSNTQSIATLGLIEKDKIRRTNTEKENDNGEMEGVNEGVGRG